MQKNLKLIKINRNLRISSYYKPVMIIPVIAQIKVQAQGQIYTILQSTCLGLMDDNISKSVVNIQLKAITRAGIYCLRDQCIVCCPLCKNYHETTREKALRISNNYNSHQINYFFYDYWLYKNTTNTPGTVPYIFLLRFTLDGKKLGLTNIFLLKYLFM